VCLKLEFNAVLSSTHILKQETAKEGQLEEK
jgi:hypothetical protein